MCCAFKKKIFFLVSIHYLLSSTLQYLYYFLLKCKIMFYRKNLAHVAIVIQGNADRI